jgi:CheY-like chemotaxis protein
VADDGATGLRLAAERRPDLLFLDVHLPDIEGTEVLARLRADPATTAIPVVFLTADATAPALHRLAAAGADGHLTKPYELAALFDRVERARPC